MPTFFKGRSLRFWVALGMFMGLAPITVSSIVGYAFLNRAVIDAFHDVASRQTTQVGPLQALRIDLWDTLIPVSEYVGEGGAEQPLLYRNLRDQIEAGFVDLRAALSHDPSAIMHLDNAFESWRAADAQATELTSVSRAAGDPEAVRIMERFHGQIAAASDRLGQVHVVVARVIAADHDMAVSLSQTAQWVMGSALAISLAVMGGGVVMVGVIMTRSVDRLVDGAARFADGDRDHRIQISLPPELHRVAQEFNRMIVQIEESETALADLARVDDLTQLLNRRAFEEALARAFADPRQGPGALMTLDIDHFKRVNDTLGHAAGDDVLRGFARTVKAALRPTDRLYRIGGEEFAVIFHNTEIGAASALANRLLETVSGQPIAYRDTDIAITTSIGVAKFVDGMEPRAVLEAADAALYRAKATGRNRAVVIDEAGLHEPPAAENAAVRSLRPLRQK